MQVIWGSFDKHDVSWWLTSGIGQFLEVNYDAFGERPVQYKQYEFWKLWSFVSCKHLTAPCDDTLAATYNIFPPTGPIVCVVSKAET